jgi:predicted AAA+ superfamily ATPase
MHNRSLFFVLNRHKHGKLKAVRLGEIRSNDQQLRRIISQDSHPLPAFRSYLETGYLQIIAEGKDTYLLKLRQVINTIVDVDLAYIASYNSGTAVKIKELLAVLAESIPFKPNIGALVRKLGMSRDSVYQYIYKLRYARLLNTLSAEGKGESLRTVNEQHTF